MIEIEEITPEVSTIVLQDLEDVVRRQQFLYWLQVECGIQVPRELHGRWFGIHKYMFTWAIVGSPMFDRDNIEWRWCYKTSAGAVAALEAWDGTGEPRGWHRHPATGRRVAEDGTEYVER